MSLARTERAALADLFAEVGPERPTLCEGWNTGDLLNHLLVRERRPDAAGGMFVPALAGWTRRVTAGYAEQSWDERIALLRNGPPVWNPMRIPAVDAAANGAEMLIHHEDVRRGEPGWAPRQLDPVTQRQVVALLGNPLTRLALRRAGVGLTAVVTDTAGDPERRVVVREAAPTVELRGGSVDLVLVLAGRSAATVEVTGPPAAVDAFRAAPFGL